MRVPTWLRFALILAAVLLVVKMANRERFSVPVVPSAEQDERLVTPAGNVITY